MSFVLAVVTISVVGLMVGVEFSVAFVINSIADRLPSLASTAVRSDGARMLGRVMPFWYIASLVLTVALTALTWGARQRPRRRSLPQNC